MNITIPLYIEKLSPEGTPAPLYTVRPLFFSDPVARGEDLNRTVNRLVKDLREEIKRLGKSMRHEELAAFSFSPVVEDHLLKLVLDLGSRKVACRFLIATFEALDRKVAFSPSVPDLWFEVGRGETLADRATENLVLYFREKEKRDPKSAPKPEEMSVEGKAWVTTLDLDIHPPQLATPPQELIFAALTTSAELDGETELDTVGRCLDHLFPDELSRVICRDREVEEITRLLSGVDKRPVLLAGPRMVGKTAIIHEYVYQKVARKKSRYSSKRNLWLLSPQRLISGMSYVGQWENRLLAILKEAEKREHTLYFDDLLGLFHAGVTSSSTLSVADVLKPFVEKRQFRLLAEITPEAYRVLQEKDRGFADLFHVIQVREPGEGDVIRILISLIRRLEQQHNCHFAIEVLPAVLDLERRYVRDAAFPGKAAAFLNQLAVKYRNIGILREAVLEEFHAKSGLRMTFLSNRASLERWDVIEAIGNEVIGQTEAIEAVTDAVCVARARLNDPNRPIASFLFLGPTGVGKTQCAKSVARYLFGDADKMLRFDMNEYSSAYSVARLVGTFDQPEGLLTSAIRRRPFAVVLLDEIEKAHPDVFNLLLQVMGDGRLTDALGRTADFTNAILIMTSNLGVREASSNLGFRQDHAREASAYIQAAEKFFKPEFFNRLDRVIPFERLRREDVGKIAQTLIQEVFAREGLVRRKCVLRVDERAMERIIDEGYHPQLGARALKRALEQQLTQPIAARLALLRPDAPTIVSLYPDKTGLAVSVDALIGARTDDYLRVIIEALDSRAVLARIDLAVDRIEAEVTHLRPEGPITPEAIEPDQYRYFLIQEQARRIRNISRRLAERIDRPEERHEARSRGRSLAAGQMTLRQTDEQDLWKQIIAAPSVQGYLRELAANSPPYGDKIEDQLAVALRETSLLETIADPVDPKHNRALIHIRSLSESGSDIRARLIKLYTKLFGNQLGLDVTGVENDGEILENNASALLITGAQAQKLAKTEEGTHLFYTEQENIFPAQVRVLPVIEGEGAKTSLRGFSDTRLLPVIRIYEEQGHTLDLRSGLITLKLPTAHELRAFALARLDLPLEFRQD